MGSPARFAVDCRQTEGWAGQLLSLLYCHHDERAEWQRPAHEPSFASDSSRAIRSRLHSPLRDVVRDAAELAETGAGDDGDRFVRAVESPDPILQRVNEVRVHLVPVPSRLFAERLDGGSACRRCDQPSLPPEHGDCRVQRQRDPQAAA
jgi:hypothetical protein